MTTQRLNRSGRWVTTADHPEHILQLVASGDITMPDIRFCWCCSGITDRPQRTASYWWLTKTLRWLGLCARCCAIWRRDTAGDPFLAPVRVTNQRPPGSKAA